MNFESIKEILSLKKVGIAGCGGLGSNAAVILARSGIGKLVLADFDHVSESNLNRQFYFFHQIGEIKVDALSTNLLAIRPDLEVITHYLKLESNTIYNLFKNCDLVIEAFDSADAKAMIVETFINELPNTPLIVGNGMAGFGKFELLNRIKWTNNIYVCGDSQSEIDFDLPPLAPRVGIVANMQADLALELLINGTSDLDIK